MASVTDVGEMEKLERDRRPCVALLQGEIQNDWALPPRKPPF